MLIVPRLNMSENLTQAPSTALERSTQAVVPTDASARQDVALEDFYDISGAASFVKTNNFQMVLATSLSVILPHPRRDILLLQAALQFPDWMLSDAFDIVDALEVRNLTYPILSLSTDFSCRLQLSRNACLSFWQIQATAKTVLMKWLHRFVVHSGCSGAAIFLTRLSCSTSMQSVSSTMDLQQ